MNAQQEPKWKYPLIAAIIIVPALLFLANWAYTQDRANKLAAYLTYPQSVQTDYCETRGAEHAKALQSEWEKHWNGLGVIYSGSISTLHFEDVLAFADARCVEARAVVQQAKDAVTDQQKLAAYYAARNIHDASADVITDLQDRQLASAIACADSYADAEALETESKRTDQFATDARGYIAQGNWDFCQFYSQQSMVISGQVISCTVNITNAAALEQVVGTNPLADQARAYQSQENWTFCAFYADQAVKAMQPQMPQSTSSPP